MNPTSPAPSSPLPPVSHSRHSRFQCPFPTHFMLSLPGPFIHPTFLPESCLYSNIHFKFYLLTLPTSFLQVTVFNPIWHQQGRKSKGRGWVNNPSLAKGLRGQVCLERKPKLLVFLPSLSCCPMQSFQ